MLPRSKLFLLVGALMALMPLYLLTSRGLIVLERRPVNSASWRTSTDAGYLWRTVTTDFPAPTIQNLPTGEPKSFPRVQTNFGTETGPERDTREQRQSAVKDAFLRSWDAYREYAWGSDQLAPVSAGVHNPYGGWAATLVDALDTLWIMNLKDEFAQAVDAIDYINFEEIELGEVNTYQVTVRFLGAFLSAYDLSGDSRLLRKAEQVGDMVYKAFDTPNRMPVTHWNFHEASGRPPRDGKKKKSKGKEEKKKTQEAATRVVLAEIGSLGLELTRLSQLTKDPKWFDAVQRITDVMAAQQDSTEVPGLFPLTVNAKDLDFKSGSDFSLGAMGDSAYEYMPKMAALLGGLVPAYQDMYSKAMDAAIKHSIFRPMTPTDEDILLAGAVWNNRSKPANESATLKPQGQHLMCYLGGAMALGGRLFDREGDVTVGKKLTDGCIYSYKAFPYGVMPERFEMVPCDSTEKCTWDDSRWKEAVVERADSEDGKKPKASTVIKEQYLPKGFTTITDRKYSLRPEAIESVFVMYRVTGEASLLDKAWEMFQAVNSTTATALGNSVVLDVTVKGKKPEPNDVMESFWLAETLKYFYLVFSEPNLISLDEYVFNTLAHPLRRPF